MRDAMEGWLVGCVAGMTAQRPALSRKSALSLLMTMPVPGTVRACEAVVQQSPAAAATVNVTEVDVSYAGQARFNSCDSSMGWKRAKTNGRVAMHLCFDTVVPGLVSQHA